MQIGVETSKAVENKRVFVVDTDEIARAALQFMLHDDNETHEFADIDAALRKSVHWRPDLLVLGADLLHAHGLGLVADLKARIAGVKILVLIDAADDAFAAAARQAGADGVLRKPLTIEKSRGAVDALLGRRRAAIPIHPV